MFSYLLRRLLYMIPIVLGVMVLTFLLFFLPQPVEIIAAKQLGQKATAQSIENWLHQHNFDKPLWANVPWTVELEPFSQNLSWRLRPQVVKELRYHADRPLFDSLFFQNFVDLATFRFGTSLSNGEDIASKMEEQAIPSLLITAPAFFVGLLLSVSAALFFVYVRESRVDFSGTVFCVMLMSIPVMVYVIFFQWVLGAQLKYLPAFGYSDHGWDMARFLLLPIFAIVISALGSDTRLYRAIFLEEIRNEYVRTAQAKGTGPARVLFTHVLKNGMINIITLTVSSLPLLILGTLLVEDFFGIPGLGSLTMDAIHNYDYTTVRAVTFISSLLYLIGLLLTDICYALVDPRIKLK
jgi:peptide/nickel transport system permease protein